MVSNEGSTSGSVSIEDEASHRTDANVRCAMTGMRSLSGAIAAATDDGGGSNGKNDVRGNDVDRTRVRHRPRAEPQTRPGRPKNAALRELTYGAGIYGACVALPSLPHLLLRVYLWSCNAVRLFGIISRSLLWGTGEGDGNGDGDGDAYESLDDESTNGLSGGGEDGFVEADASARGSFRYFLRKTGHYLVSSTSSSIWEDWTQSSSPTKGGEDPNYVWGFGRASSGLTMVLRDIQFVSMLAVTLAVTRIWLVHMFVPEYLAPRRLEALTRCKSSHLLCSSSYRFEGSDRWEEVRRKSGDRTSLNIGEIGMVGGGGEIGTGGGVDVSSRAAHAISNGRIWNRYDRFLRWTSEQWYRLRPSIRRALGHEPTARYNKLAPSSTRLLFSAPRHATAVFRLIYCSASCLSALILFRSAEFWPHAVGGSNPNASTENCWDLSGSIVALGSLDADYDHRNAALRYFFLTQASYQLHSLCFHVVSMMLLLLYGGASLMNGKHGNGGGEGMANEDYLRSVRLVSMKTSMQSYIRPMTEHVIVLGLVLGSYLFSSLRRLGAVGIFTLEVSSVFLQLLQVCINAPESSRLRRPGMVIFVHRFLTIPTFLYCRFFVLPFVVWYSAAFESLEWLEQIEKAFSPGWGKTIWSIFNGSLLLVFALNLVLFRRLLFHPHLRQIKHEASRPSN